METTTLGLGLAKIKGYHSEGPILRIIWGVYLGVHVY